MSKSNRWILLCIGTLVFGSELIFGIWMAHWNYFIPGDAISRVANAFYVLYSRDPHLGAVGFVWNPLPSLLILPILLFNRWIPELANEGISGVILTSLFASAMAVFLFRNFSRRGHSVLVSIFFVFIFIFNPFMFLYGSNGMSETLFIFFIIVCVTYLTDLMDTENNTISLILIGFSLALAFFTRYESIFFGAALSLSAVVIILNHYKNKEYHARTVYQKIEAAELIILLPAIYGGLLWIFLNWSIMGDALYFLHSNYSNLAQSENLSTNPIIAPVIGNWLQTIQYVLLRSIPFSIPFVLIVLVRAFTGKLFKMDFLCLVILILSVPLMQLIMLYKGASYGWLRFFVYPLPIVMAWLPYELGKLKTKKKILYKITTLAVISSLIFSSYVTWLFMNNRKFAPEEYDAIHAKQSPTYLNRMLAKRIAGDLDKRLSQHPDSKILMDSFNAFQIILNSRHNQQLVITSDLDFEKSLNHPVKHKITYILVPKPNGVASLNAVTKRYKNFYYRGASFAKLEKEYGEEWRLYRLFKPSSTKNK
ncbi:hypothetical protein NIE88_11500 [Sporolactobacillus shoreicorticis]|uniref:Glycosyltransferase RgtA/B/C/D-like domain-containing protein n=1 Tax=Sporolactobacillus shoreicorticis TaxID=1923877 RepID=A0ABW5S5G1_9BACL|nr:hypothetical protein [Sporolactobacillus shoreicorticis]MCO7126396.1 hypothetical protein [Sporolactobacillus shoreicorticis]